MNGISNDPSVAATYGHAAELAAKGGKRSRPYVASLLYRACSGKDDADIMSSLMALETFHLFALVHDDIMDGGAERYGMPTMHIAVRDRLNTVEPERAMKAAEAEAILVGDLLLTLVHEMMLDQLESPIDARLVTQAHKMLIRMSKEIVIGQHLDMDYTTRTDVPDTDILRRHHLKTALYTFVRPMQIGTTLAGADGPVLKFCEEFGTELGLGFQLEDDLLDVLGEESALGKRLGSDLSQRQHTLLTSDFRKRANATQRARFESYWGHELSADQLHDVKKMFEETGTLEAVREKARTAFTAAGHALEKSPLPAEANSALSELLTFFVHRLP